MTLCVAAICEERKGKSRESRIVIATDWRGETSEAGAETTDKLYWIWKGCPVMIAGNVSRAIELKDTYRQALVPLLLMNLNAPMLRDNSFDILKSVLPVYKRKLAEEFIGTTLGINYETFLQSREKLGDETYRALVRDVGKIEQDGQLLICTFVPLRHDEPELIPLVFRVEDWEVVQCDNFGTIGSGGSVADAVLFQRAHDEGESLATTLYNVFEATKLGSIAPGVGEHFTMTVLYPQSDGEVLARDLSAKGRKYLESKFREFGPKSTKKLEFKEEFLDKESTL
jgi:hypothetical protein